MRRPAALGAASLLVLLAAAPAPAQERQAPAATLDTVRVTVSSRAESPSLPPARTVEVISRAEIDRIPGRTLADVLSRAIGADLVGRSPASTDLAIRGSSFEQVLVLVDGVRVSDDQTGHFDLDLAVPLDVVERVEILRGSGSALYGPDAVGGVVNVVTRRAARDTRGRTIPVSGRVTGGSFGTAGGSLLARIGTGGGGSAVVAGDYVRSTGHRPGTDFRVGQGHAAWDAPTPVGRLSTSVGVGVRDFGAADFYGAFPSAERTGSGTVAARLESRPRERWSVSTAASARRHTDLFTLRRENPGAYQNRHATWQTGAETVVRLAAGEGLVIAAGAEGYRSTLASARLGDRAEDREAAFAEATAGRAGAGSVNAGMRVDRSSTFGTFVSPSLAGAYAPGAGMRVRASGARGFRAPTWTERYYEDPANHGDPALRPETFWTGEVGATVDVSPAPSGSMPRLRVDVAGFARRARDLIDWAKPSGAGAEVPWRTTNVEEATFRGAELKAEMPALLGAMWTLRAMGLSFDARAAEGYAGKYALRPVTRSASLAVAAPLRRSLTLALEAGHARRAGEAGFVRGDARLTYARSDLRAHLDLLNLTGADYLDATAHAVPGRAVYLSLEWQR